MATLDQHRAEGTSMASRNGDGAVPETAGRSCALCGQSASGAAVERFGEPFCSDAHAEAFAGAVRAARTQAPLAGGSTTAVERTGAATAEVSTAQSWKRRLKMGLCCGAPLVALAVLAGGGGAVLGAAGAFLPALATLACPLGMYLMMRSMAKTGRHDDRVDKGGVK